VKDKLVRSLRQQKENENSRAYLQQMLVKQPVELNEIELSRFSSH
jgi:hypothetical protein